VKRYLPPRYQGSVALFRAEAFPAREPDLGWSALLPRLDVIIVPGDHHTCITRHVAVFAKRLDEVLRGAESDR
jgi:thioesterase domain-containing protein